MEADHEDGVDHLLRVGAALDGIALATRRAVRNSAEMTRTLGVLVIVLAVGAGCAGEPDEGASADQTTIPASPTAVAPTTTPAPPDDVCDELAEPVGVLSGTLESFPGPDLDQVTSQEAWDRMILQYEANAEAMTEIGAVVPQLREATDEASSSFAERAAAGRAAEPDLALIDRARQASRSRIDPVAVVTGLEPIMAADGPVAEVAGFVSRTCPELGPNS